jgi:hypothetical protein
MRKVITVLLLLVSASFLFAADDNNVTYIGCTAPQLKEASAGRFDFSVAGQLRFISAGSVLEIMWDTVRVDCHG